MKEIKRPDCWDFAMDFLGGPDDSQVKAVTEYVEQLEAEVARLRRDCAYEVCREAPRRPDTTEDWE